MIKMAALSQLKKFMKWGEEDRPHLMDEYGGQLKHECGICWLELGEEVNMV